MLLTTFVTPRPLKPVKFIATAPTRCSFLGGGSDADPFAKEFGGRVFSAAINLRMSATLTTHSKPTVELESLGEKRTLISLTKRLSYGKDPKFDLVRAIINYFRKEIPSGFSLKTATKADSVMGLGSSGATAVSIIGAFNAWLKKDMSPMEIALLAARMEIEELGWSGGKQDQIAAAFGGINEITFGPNLGIGIVPLQLDTKTVSEFKRWTRIVFLGGYRHSKEQQKVLTKGMSEKDKQRALIKLREAAKKATVAVKDKNWPLLGSLLDKSWIDKKKSNPIVSNETIDSFYDSAKRVGMIGGKIMGSGGAGHMLVIANPKDMKKIIHTLTELGAKNVDFDFDFNGLTVTRHE